MNKIVLRDDFIKSNKKYLLSYHGRYNNFYTNPDNPDEILVVYEDKCALERDKPRLDKIIEDGLGYAHDLSRAIFPKDKVYIGDELKGYSMTKVKNAITFSSYIYDASLSTNLDTLLKADDVLQSIHGYDVSIGDLNPTNILMDDYDRVYLVDLLDCKIGKYYNYVLSTALCDFYCSSFLDKCPGLDNANMHLNLFMALTKDDEILIKEEEEYERCIKRLKLPTPVTDTYLRMRQRSEISNTPPVTKTIKQML